MSPNDRRQLRQSSASSRGCLGAPVFAQVGHLSRQIVDTKALAELDEQIPVQAPVQLLVEIAHRLDGGSPEERRLLQDEIRDIDEVPELERLRCGKAAGAGAARRTGA